MKKIIFIVVIVIATAITMTTIFRPYDEPDTRETWSLGTIIRISTWGDRSGEALDKALIRLEEIDSKMSAKSPRSEIGILNDPANISTDIGDDTIFVVEEALRFSKLTDGAFDPTVGPIVELWGIGTESEKLPSQEEISETLSFVDYRKVVLDRTTKRLELKKKGQRLDLGGIAKGYAADEIAKILREQGIESALIDLGGNIFLLGRKADGLSWKIGIQNPYLPRGEYMGILSTWNRSIVTSGSYERFFEVDGVRYHHIFDPHTGYPSKSDLSSVTIVSKKSIEGDALSTAVYVMGRKKGMKLIESIDGVEAILVKNHTIYLSSGLDDFQLTNEDFKIAQRR